MNEYENKYRLLCDRLTNVLRVDNGFAERWGHLLASFEEIEMPFLDDYRFIDSYEKLTRLIAENPGGRYDRVRDALGRAEALTRWACELMTGRELTNRLAEVRLRLICRTLNECFPSDTPRDYVWGPAFDVLDLPCRKEDGKDYGHCVKTANGDWLCPAGGSTEDGELLRRGYFSFNSQDKAAFAAETFAGLFRDWLDTELGFRRIEL